MSQQLLLCWKYIRAIALIYFSLFAGNAIASLLPITIPGSIVGMLLLFALLSSHILPAEWAKPGCRLFIRSMVLLFVPICVGVMKYHRQIIDNLGPLVVSCLLSTLMIFVVVGYTSQHFHRERTMMNKSKDTEADQ